MSGDVLPKAWENLITSSNYLPVIVRSIERFFDPEWSTKVSEHKDFEMVYVKKGSGEFIVEGSSVVIGPNDILIIKPYQKHNLKVVSKEGCEFIVLSFKFEGNKHDSHAKVSLNHFLDFVKGKESGSYIKLKVSQKNDIIVLLNRILSEKNKEDIGSDFLKRLYVLELFVLISRALKMEWEDSIKTQKCKIKELVEISINYINRNFEREITISEIAKYVFLSQSYFAKVFKDHTGISPQGFLLSVRVDRAKEMMLNTDMRIGEIALSVGFSNQQRFNDIFKKNTGMSPLCFKKEYRDKNNKKSSI